MINFLSQTDQIPIKFQKLRGSESRTARRQINRTISGRCILIFSSREGKIEESLVLSFHPSLDLTQLVSALARAQFFSFLFFSTFHRTWPNLQKLKSFAFTRDRKSWSDFRISIARSRYIISVIVVEDLTQELGVI